MYYGSGWKKPRFWERRSLSRKQFAYRRFQRASAQVQRRSNGEILPGRVFLHDLTTEGVGVFLSSPLPKGEAVFLVLEHPKHVFIRGRIVWCTLYRLNTRVLSAENFQYRAGIRFDFETEAERQLLAHYFEELHAAS